MMILTERLPREMTAKVKTAWWEMAGMCHSAAITPPEHRHTQNTHLTSETGMMESCMEVKGREPT